MSRGFFDQGEHGGDGNGCVVGQLCVAECREEQQETGAGGVSSLY